MKSGSMLKAAVDGSQTGPQRGHLASQSPEIRATRQGESYLSSTAQIVRSDRLPSPNAPSYCEGIHKSLGGEGQIPWTDPRRSLGGWGRPPADWWRGPSGPV